MLNGFGLRFPNTSGSGVEPFEVELNETTIVQDDALKGKSKAQLQLALNGIEIFSSLPDTEFDSATGTITFEDISTGILKGFIIL